MIRHYLVDVNVLVAWGWADHLDHDRTVCWIAEQRRIRAAQLFTSPISEIGFVRVSVQRAAGRVTVQQAVDVLRWMLGSLGKSMNPHLQPPGVLQQPIESHCRLPLPLPWSLGR